MFLVIFYLRNQKITLDSKLKIPFTGKICQTQYLCPNYEQFFNFNATWTSAQSLTVLFSTRTKVFVLIYLTFWNELTRIFYIHQKLKLLLTGKKGDKYLQKEIMTKTPKKTALISLAITNQKIKCVLVKKVGFRYKCTPSQNIRN